jgi:hypothetical protein
VSAMIMSLLVLRVLYLIFKSPTSVQGTETAVTPTRPLETNEPVSV